MNSIKKSSTDTVTQQAITNNMSAAMTKLNKALATFADETTLAAIDNFVAAFKQEFELDEDDMTAFVTKYKSELAQKSKDAAKEATKKPKKAQKLDADGNVIKREPSEYNKFVQAKMEELKANNPDLKGKGKELMAMAAAEWKKHKAAKASESETESA